MLEFLMLCSIEMGTQVFNDEAETDTESIINYTRQPKKPPPYVPRSRSLGDLPGGIRVPIIKKQDSRLHQKHEANMAGLEELKMLRQKHGQMVDDMRTTLTPPETVCKLSSLFSNDCKFCYFFNCTKLICNFEPLLLLLQ